MNTKQETVPLLTQTCPLHTSEPLNLICVSQECLNYGFICKVCRKFHENHNIMEGQDFLDLMKKLVNYDGTYKVPNSVDLLSAKTISGLMSIIEQLEVLTQYFSEKLSSIRLLFDRYKQVTNDFCALNNLIYYAYGTDSQQDLFREQLQGVLKRMCFHQQKLQITSIAMCNSNFLFLPNMKLHQDMDPIVKRLREIQQIAETDLISPNCYNKLDLSFKTGLELLENYNFDPVVFETEQPTDEDKILEKFIIDRPDNNPFRKFRKYKSKVEQQQNQEEPYHQGSGRVEKVTIVAGQKIWYHDLAYPRFKPRSWMIEPRNACIICKCHPKFARIKEFLNCKYGDLYGPVHIDSDLFAAFKKAVAYRKEKQYLVERTGIYFHDLCIYWSYMIECDEVTGKLDFESLCNVVRQSYKIFCYLCKRRGATMKCNYPDCEIWIHYYCWKELDSSQQFLDAQRFKMLCFKHVPEKYQKPDWLFSKEVQQHLEKQNQFGGQQQRIQEKVKVYNQEDENQSESSENEEREISEFNQNNQSNQEGQGSIECEERKFDTPQIKKCDY